MKNYTQQDLTKLVELYYGEFYPVNIRPDSKVGSDRLFSRMENFLEALDKEGLQITQKSNCKCGKH